MSCGVGRRRGLDPTLLWLWRRPAATALIRPLAWEPPYALGEALKIKKTKKKKKSCMSCLYILEINLLSVALIGEVFLPFCGLSFHFVYGFFLLCKSFKFD